MIGEPRRGQPLSRDKKLRMRVQPGRSTGLKPPVFSRTVIHKDMKTNRFKTIFLISFLGAIVTACAYVLARYIRLDPSDGAYKFGLLKSLFDPFVITIALTVAIPIALIASPILYFFLRHKKLNIAYPAIQLLTIVAIFVIPDSTNDVITGACITMIVSALVFWASPFANLESKG